MAHGVSERLPSDGPHQRAEIVSVVTKWVGHDVVLKYLGGPDEPLDKNDPKGLAHANLETRFGIFYLHKYGEAGIEISRGLEEADSDRVTLIP